jgi:D-glycero-beta-D-manno-heptose 1-phosphate adenylyltransferase
MTQPRSISEKMIDLEALVRLRAQFRIQGRKVVFTNGCFDLLHSGHIATLQSAHMAGDVLIVAINSDASVQAIKGPKRPIIPERERLEILASMSIVDYVVVFEEPDPGALIARIVPDILVKGGDWAENAIVGREVVEKNGGVVLRIPPLAGRSSTNIIAKIIGN